MACTHLVRRLHLSRAHAHACVVVCAANPFPSDAVKLTSTCHGDDAIGFCEQLFQAKRDFVARKLRDNLVRKEPPKLPGENVEKSPLRVDEDGKLKKISEERLRQIRETARQLTGNIGKAVDTVGQAREECFVVYD